MNIKSLLLGSAAALAAVSGAHAADAIVAAEPEAMEYVRVCDAFGTGYFYIPGTETCLKIGGYVRTQLNFDDAIDDNELSTATRAQLEFDAKNDTEFGTLSSYIVLRAQTNAVNVSDHSGAYLSAAWINFAGFDVGNYYTWWDDDLSGETDVLSDNDTTLNGIRYTYDGGAYRVGVAVEDLEGADTSELPGSLNPDGKGNDNIGISALVGGTIGGLNAQLIGSYDANVDEAAFRAIVTADIGPGTLGVAGIYATDPTYYWYTSEWTVAAEYAIKATDKLTITPAAQYFGDVGFNSDLEAWKVGVTAGYKITEGLKTLATVNYTKADGSAADALSDDDNWTGFLRLQRDF
ncbi:porin [Rhizobium sp. NFR03]|uniref:porin n=1 Tax=Rhizobium sp. NFR03 TaxID=1566263 RepID=UPI0008C74FFB|nr:porin [Rhizobium sp. NFR03]SES15114.1 Porin subfamily protein [Rhizobium sp. NFR03]